VSVASSFLSYFSFFVVYLLYLYPRVEDYPEYQNVIFAQKGRTRVGKMVFFYWLGRVRLGWKIEVFGPKGQAD